ncbi:hypothetical protein QJS10_CPB20g00164 [Acorus calamus]|uniref:Transcription factor Iwr1 domain-containing protein n=1 Tax=Acorus calamus TaxID=4465 RepID=A0AAV9CBK4_ACOCL|nr:hypothetical protein QJS10_CPB20g00164 [Acorus calamus]
MAETSTSSPPPTSKPLFVRVKRKSFQEKLDAFWLEIKERPLKRPLLDFGNLSLSDSSKKEELKTKKVLVQHVETINRSNDMGSVLQSYLPNLSSVNENKTMFEGRRHLYQQENKHDLLLSTAKKKHEDFGRNARFEQIWKSRKGNKDDNVDPLRDMCQIYDVIRVDVEDEIPKVKEKEDTTDYTALLCNYLPMLREFIPEAAKEIESDLLVEESKKDDYVYDVYTVENDTTESGEESCFDYPLVQVDEDDYCDDDQQSDYETDDSNAENNPLFDYPEEESTETEVESQGSSDPEEGSDSEGGNEMLNEDYGDYKVGKLMEGHGSQYEEDLPGDYDDEDDWKWEHH